MNIWRINLKPNASTGVDSRQFCLKKGIVGIGWQVDYKRKPVSWETYEKIATKKYYDKGDASWWPAINAIYYRMEKNDLIWTRDIQGIYYIGRITSDWYYDTSRDCENADIVNIRKCDWKEVGTIESVPGKIVNSFIPARTVQKVNGETIEIFSKYIYNNISNSSFYKISIPENSNVFSLLSSNDCEDILGLYLQLEKDYMIVPSSCKTDTMNYEYVLIRKTDSKKAVAQVKNGWVDLNSDDYSNIKSIIYLFTTKGLVNGDLPENVRLIKAKEMERFIFKNRSLMPQTIKNWIDIYKELS